MSYLLINVDLLSGSKKYLIIWALVCLKIWFASSQNITVPIVATTVSSVETTEKHWGECHQIASQCLHNYTLSSVRTHGKTFTACTLKSKIKLRWLDALEWCEARNAGLLYAAAKLETDGDPHWFGLSYDTSSGEYLWNLNRSSYGGVVTKKEFKNLGLGCCNYTEQNKHCGFITPNETLELGQCDEAKYFACQMDGIVPTSERMQYPDPYTRPEYKGYNGYVRNGTSITMQCFFNSDKRNLHRFRSMSFVGPGSSALSRLNQSTVTTRVSACEWEIVISVQGVNASAELNGLYIHCSQFENDSKCVYNNTNKNNNWITHGCTNSTPLVVMQRIGSTFPVMEYTLDRKPDMKYENSSFTFDCTALEGTISNKVLFWTVTVDGKPNNFEQLGAIFDKNNSGYNITTTRMTNRIIFESLNETHDGMQVACHVVEVADMPNITHCREGNNSACVQTPIIHIIIPPGRPTLKVHFHEAPNIVYGGEPLEADCSANVGEDGDMMWVMVFPDKTLYPNNENDLSNLEIDEMNRTIMDDGTEVVTSNLTIGEISDEHDGMYFLCLSYVLEVDPKNRMMHCPTEDQFCVESKPLKLLKDDDDDDDDDGDDDEDDDDGIFIVIIAIQAAIAAIVCLLCIRIMRKCSQERNEDLSKKPSRCRSLSAPQSEPKPILHMHDLPRPRHVIENIGSSVDKLPIAYGETVIFTEIGPMGEKIQVAETAM